MLTPEQIEATRTRLGITPVQKTPVVDRASELSSAWGEVEKPTVPAVVGGELGQRTGELQKEGIKKITTSLSKAKEKITAPETSVLRTIGAVAEGALGSASGAITSTFAPLTAFMEKALSRGGEEPSITAPEKPEDAPLKPALESIKAWAVKHPEAATNLLDAFNVGATALGLKVVPKPTQGLTKTLSGVKQGATEVLTTRSTIANEKFINQLVTPTQTTGKTGTLTANIRAGKVDEGGLLSGRTVNPDTHQLAIEAQVKSVPGIKQGQTLLQNANAIHDEIGNTALKLQNDLVSREIQPILTNDVWSKYMNGVVQSIKENPLLVGDAEKTASKILDKFQSLLPKNKDITASDILQARKELDVWMKNIKGDVAFDPKTENAVSIALRAVRQGANDLIETTAPDVAVKEMLRRQSLLYDALENIAPKAAKEAGSQVGRVAGVIKKHPIISTLTGITGIDIILNKIGL